MVSKQTQDSDKFVVDLIKGLLHVRGVLKSDLADMTDPLSLTEILQRYQTHVEIGEGASKGVGETQEEYPKYTDALSNKQLLEIVERELGGDQCGDHLSVTDLMNLEKQFQEALIHARSTKTRLQLDSISSLHEKEKMLAEEKRGLEEKIAQTNTNQRTKNMIFDLNFLAECHIME